MEKRVVNFNPYFLLYEPGSYKTKRRRKPDNQSSHFGAVI
jgi:hypothetical protein